MPPDLPAVPPTPSGNPRVPFTIADILDESRRYKPDVLQALRAFKREKPWAGTPEERAAKLRSLHGDLCIAYRLPTPPTIRCPSARGSGYDIASNTIHVATNLSVISYLHSFAMAMARDPKEASAWSVNLFKRMFPHSYARLVPVGPVLVRPENVHEAREAFGLNEPGTSGAGEVP